MQRQGAGVRGPRVTRGSAAYGRAVRAVVGSVVLLTALRAVAAGLPGEDPLAIKDAIGRGIHAFHTGDFDRAYDDLTQAIEAGSDDPRVFYFRGLAALRLGRTGEADADFAAGAEREATDGGTARVSRSLERVQGCDRLSLERHRARARLAGLQRDRQVAGRRYSTIEDPSSELLRRRRPEDVTSELLAPRRGDGVEEVPAPRPAGPRAKPGKPFADDPEEMEGDDPFGAKPRSAAKDGAEDAEMATEDEKEMAEKDDKDAAVEEPDTK